MSRWFGPGRTPAVALGAAAVGLVIETLAGEWARPEVWLPDLAVGWLYLVVGHATWSRHRPGGGTLVMCGVAWFAGTAAGPLAFAHRGPLAQLALGARGVPGVAAVYLAASAPVVGRSDVASLMLALLVSGATFVLTRRSPRGDQHRRLRRVMAAGLAVAIAGGTAVRLLGDGRGAQQWSLGLYQAALGATALVAGGTLVRGRTSLADLIVELGEDPGGALELALREILRDPTLRVGFAAETGFLDASGQPMDTSRPMLGRRSTVISDDTGRALAVLVHDASIVPDLDLIEGLRVAAGLRQANENLHRSLGQRIVDLESSRRRLLEVGDSERRRLNDRLRTGPARHLAQLDRRLAAIAVGRSADVAPEVLDEISAARAQIARTVVDLDHLADGLHPSDLDGGLIAAIEALTERCPLTTDVRIEPCEVPSTAAAVVLYFVCAEALANAAKHAEASLVEVRLGAGPDGVLILTIGDDGCGGADPSAGSGLAGLRDRVEALGGTLTVESPPGKGTRLGAELPLGPQPVETVS